MRCGSCTKHNSPCTWPAPLGNGTSNRSEGKLEIDPSNTEQEVVVGHQCITSTRNSLVRSFSDDSTKIGVLRSALYGLPGITTSTDHYLSTHLRERFLPNVLRGDAHKAFHDWRPLIAAGTEKNIAMKAYLATAAMHASWIEKKFRTVALKYYNSAISDLRRDIEGGHVHGSEDWLVHTTSFLCLFEVMSQSNADSENDRKEI